MAPRKLPPKGGTSANTKRAAAQRGATTKRVKAQQQETISRGMRQLINRQAARSKLKNAARVKTSSRVTPLPPAGSRSQIVKAGSSALGPKDSPKPAQKALTGTGARQALPPGQKGGAVRPRGGQVSTERRTGRVITDATDRLPPGKKGGEIVKAGSSAITTGQKALPPGKKGGALTTTPPRQRGNANQAPSGGQVRTGQPGATRAALPAGRTVKVPGALKSGVGGGALAGLAITALDGPARALGERIGSALGDAMVKNAKANGTSTGGPRRNTSQSIPVEPYKPKGLTTRTKNSDYPSAATPKPKSSPAPSVAGEKPPARSAVARSTSGGSQAPSRASQTPPRPSSSTKPPASPSKAPNPPKDGVKPPDPPGFGAGGIYSRMSDKSKYVKEEVTTSPTKRPIAGREELQQANVDRARRKRRN